MKDIAKRTWKLGKATLWVYLVLVLFLVLLGHNPLVFGGIFILLGIYFMIWALRKMFATLRQ